MPSIAASQPSRRCALLRTSGVLPLVIVGLAGSLLLAVSIGPWDGRSLPGVALDSPALLVVERTLGFFAAWMVVLVICAQAIDGRLPTEISGRGVRYADAAAAQTTTAETERALRGMREEITQLRDVLTDLQNPGREAP